MYIGEIAKRTNASPKAIRHYESLGLLGEVTRAGSYRVYSDNDVRRVQLIRQAQALGFHLAELGSVLQGPAGEPDWAGLVGRIGLKRASVQAEIHRLNQLDSKLGEIDIEMRTCLDSRGSDTGAAGCDMSIEGNVGQKAA